MFETLERLFTRSQRVKFFTRPDVIQFVLCAVILSLHVLLLSSRHFERVENNFLDYFFQNRPAIQTDDSIAIIKIDEESLQAVGRWPWPWHYHASMVELLREWGAKAIIYHLVFKESTAAFQNEMLSKEMQKTQDVYLPVLLEAKPEKKFWIHSLPMVLDPKGGKKAWTHSVSSIESHVKAIGHSNTLADTGGVLRRVRPYLTAGDETYPYLSLRVAYDVLGQEAREKVMKLPLDNEGHFLINWAGDWQSDFQAYSFSELIRSVQGIKQGRAAIIKPEMIKDKICIVGVTVPNIAAQSMTPLDIRFPPVGIHATVLNSILSQQFVRPASFNINAACLIIIGTLVSLIFVKFRSTTSIVLGLAFGLIWIGISFLLFWKWGVWLYIFHPLILILSLYIFSTVCGYVMDSRERKRLFDLATRDGLTGLFVIRYFREILNQIVKEVKETKEPLCIVLIDIDNFKKVNDTYGHAAGDLILKGVAKIMKDHVRLKRPANQTDFVARYGGEELIIMVRNTTLEDAANKVAERIREGVEKAQFQWDGTKIPVTISLGVGILRSDENVPDAMVRRADEALYEAKRTGKNKVCMKA